MSNKDESALNRIFNITKINYSDNKVISDLVKNINKTLDDKIKNNYKNTGLYAGKDLYSIDSNQFDFNVSEIMNSVTTNNIKYKDNEIDILVANMPILSTAIELKKDNILPGDSISSDYININNKSSTYNNDEFLSNIDYIKSKYNILNIFDTTFYEMCKYGEVFHHIASFDDSVNGLIKKNKDKNVLSLNESVNAKINSNLNININFYENVIPDENNSIALFSEFTYKYENLINESKTINRRGAIIRTLKRENVIPIYINDTCLGYYYIDISEENNQIKNNSRYLSTFQSNKNNNNITLDIAKKIAENINFKFINTNHMYTNDIYNILKYIDNVENSKVNVVYIPPDNMIHWYFKKNKNNRGVSDLEKSIVPAKAYLLLSNSYKYGIITRSHDKRIYYVKQSKADANTSQIINNAIDSIKRTNNGLNFFNNMSSIAGFSGLFNDIIAPVNESGESAIQFDTLSGQNINVNMEFLEEQEKQAIESMEMPYDYVKSTNEIDFATRLNHQHGKFVKHCIKRQSMLEPLMSKFINLLYKYEYNDYVDINVKLTPPVTFKNNIITNIVDSHNTLANSLSELYIDTDPDDPSSEQKIRIWKKNFLSNVIKPYLSDLNLEEINNKTELEYAKYKASLRNSDNE